MTSLPRVALACLALALGGAFAAGCGDDDDTSTDTPPAAQAPAETETQATESSGEEETTAAAPVVVTMKGNVNMPAEVDVQVDQTVEWMNEDGYAHNVTSTAGEKIESGNFTDSFKYTPKKVGTIDYVCTIHSGQNGKLNVK